jgi:hypothetical protein
MADEQITPAPEYDDATPASDAFASPTERRRSGKAVAALACGLVSLLIAGIILGLLAIGLGIAARKEIARDPKVDGDRLALTGMIAGAIGVVLWGVLIATGVTEL